MKLLREKKKERGSLAPETVKPRGRSKARHAHRREMVLYRCAEQEAETSFWTPAPAHARGAQETHSEGDVLVGEGVSGIF